MSNNSNVFERLWKLLAKVNNLILNGKRNPQTLIDALQRILETPDFEWYKKDGMIYLTIVSNGKSGRQWNSYFDKKGIKVTAPASSILCSPKFVPTKSLIIKVAIIPGSSFGGAEVKYGDVLSRAISNHFVEKVNPEIACHLCDLFSRDEVVKKMGLDWIMVMHKPIISNGGFLLDVRYSKDDKILGASSVGTEHTAWMTNGGFAFVQSVCRG